MSTMVLFVEEGAVARLRSHSAPSAITPTPPPTTPSACRALLCMHHTAHTLSTCVHLSGWRLATLPVGGDVRAAQPSTAHTVRQTAHRADSVRTLCHEPGWSWCPKRPRMPSLAATTSCSLAAAVALKPCELCARYPPLYSTHTVAASPPRFGAAALPLHAKATSNDASANPN